ncbi:MAG: 4-(cytidine 5'-diphospho)-2-C-methyl-D-erythritol kinase [Candidatus Eisenbacteria bacterium]
MSWITLQAFAKVNLGLAVLARRPDGYHEIDTVLQTVSLADSLRLEGPRENVTLTVEGLDVPADDRNLAVRAAAALRRRTSCPGFAIRLEKRIPVAAGLGGGSSDAAAVLVGADELFGLGLRKAELEEVALGVGSDVPFLVSGGTARGRGRGELLTTLPTPRALWFVLATPRVAVTAAQGYRLGRIGLTRSAELIRLSCSAIQDGDIEALAASLVNDLEAGVASCCPDVAAARTALAQAGAVGVLMSGSGPTVVGLARDESQARDIGSRLAGRGFEISVAQATGQGSRVTGGGSS